MECLLQVALHPAYIKQKQKKHSVRKQPSSHARLFGSARRIEIRRRRSAAEIYGQRNRRSAEPCRFFASVEACGRCHLVQGQSARAADRGTARGGVLGAGSSRTARRPWPEGPGRRNERSPRTNRRRLDDRWPPPVSRQTRRLARHRQRKK